MLVKLNVNEINKENDMKVYVTKGKNTGQYYFYDTAGNAQRFAESEVYHEEYKGTVDLDIIPEPKFKVGDWVGVKGEDDTKYRVYMTQPNECLLREQRSLSLSEVGGWWFKNEMLEPSEPPKKWVKKEVEVDSKNYDKLCNLMIVPSPLRNVKITFEKYEVEE
jgi:hypothetical protein